MVTWRLFRNFHQSGEIFRVDQLRRRMGWRFSDQRLQNLLKGSYREYLIGHLQLNNPYPARPPQKMDFTDFQYICKYHPCNAFVHDLLEVQTFGASQILTLWLIRPHVQGLQKQATDWFRACRTWEFHSLAQFLKGACRANLQPWKLLAAKQMAHLLLHQEVAFEWFDLMFDLIQECAHSGLIQEELVCTANSVVLQFLEHHYSEVEATDIPPFLSVTQWAHLCEALLACDYFPTYLMEFCALEIRAALVASKHVSPAQAILLVSTLSQARLYLGDLLSQLASIFLARQKSPEIGFPTDHLVAGLTSQATIGPLSLGQLSGLSLEGQVDALQVTAFQAEDSVIYEDLDKLPLLLKNIRRESKVVLKVKKNRHRYKWRPPQEHREFREAQAENRVVDLKPIVSSPTYEMKELPKQAALPVFIQLVDQLVPPVLSMCRRLGGRNVDLISETLQLPMEGLTIMGPGFDDVEIQENSWEVSRFEGLDLFERLSTSLYHWQLIGPFSSLPLASLRNMEKLVVMAQYTFQPTVKQQHVEAEFPKKWDTKSTGEIRSYLTRLCMESLMLVEIPNTPFHVNLLLI